MNKKILNLGCGNRIIYSKTDETIVDNHDIIRHRKEINLLWDLNNPNWFTGDTALDKRPREYYDVIEFISVIEHLKLTPIESLNECWKLIKPNGYLILKYPHYKSDTSYHDPTHRWHLTEHSLDYVDPNTQLGKDYSYYTDLKWKIENVGIVKERNVKAILRPIK